MANNQQPKVMGSKASEATSSKNRIERAFSTIIKDEKEKLNNINQSMRLYEIKDLDKPEGQQTLNFNFSPN